MMKSSTVKDSVPIRKNHCRGKYKELDGSMKDYYKILRVVPDAESEIISSAYRALCRKYHPDAYKGSDAENNMREINEAENILCRHCGKSLTNYEPKHH